MNQVLLKKLIKGETVTEDDIANELYDICDHIHSSCNAECPVFRLNGNKVLNIHNFNFEVNRGCDTFKNGHAMLNFIKDKI